MPVISCKGLQADESRLESVRNKTRESYIRGMGLADQKICTWVQLLRLVRAGLLLQWV